MALVLLVGDSAQIVAEDSVEFVEEAREVLVNRARRGAWRRVAHQVVVPAQKGTRLEDDISRGDDTAR
jgi:hypothetical protein